MENAYSDKNLKKKLRTKKPKRDKYGGEDYEYSPLKQNVNVSTLAAGLVIRAGIIMLLNLGFLIFLNDCFSLGARFGALLLYAIISSTIFSLIFTGKKAALLGLGLGAVTIAIWVFVNSGIGTYIRACLECTMDTVGKLLVAKGYDNMSFLERQYEAIDTASALNSGTLFMLSMLFALILALCNMRRTLLIPTALLTTVVCLPGITYNLPSSNWGAAFVVLSLFSIITMKFFDKAYKAKKPDRLRRASLGGYAGGAVALIALVSISLPAMFMNSNWVDIPAISEPMDVARDVMSSVLSGDMPNLMDMGLIKYMDENNSRVVDPKDISFTGKSMLTVYKKSAGSSPLYLRGWVASGSFDGSAWYSASNDTLDLYEETMKQASLDAGYGEVYSPDYMTEAFFEFLGEEYSSIDDSLGYTDYSDNGYLALHTRIKIENGAGTGNLLFLPSISVTSGGLLSFDEDGAYRGKVTQHYDGMLLTGILNINKKYSVDTYSTTFSKSGSAFNLMYLISYVQGASDFIDYYMNGGANQSVDMQLDVYTNQMLNAGVPNNNISYEFFYSFCNMDYEQKLGYYNKYVVLADTYTEYVEQTYGASARYNNQFIINIANNTGVTQRDSRHMAVMKVIQYMADNYKYTTTPKTGTVQGLTPYESFLAETQEGYCMQFATTVTLILRQLGIPARYVEGFIAKDFASDGEGGYMSEVTDENAHAWVEVYYPGFGWMTYETTNRYAPDYYGLDIAVDDGSVDMGGSITPPDILPETPDTSPSEPPEEAPAPDIDEVEDPETRSVKWGKIIRTFIVIAALAAGGFLLVRYLKRKGEESVYQRTQLLSDAAYGVDSEEYRMVSHNVNATLLGMMSIAGYPPQTGELPTQYAERVDATCQYATSTDFSEIMKLIQRQEFSQAMSSADLRTVAEYTDMFWKDLYRTMSRPKQLWYRYIKRYL